MIIKIHSQNKHLLDVLHKNPNTDFGLYAKPLRNGVVIGNAIDAHNYHVVFQDTKHSYLPEESNSIDFQSFCNPLVVLNIINDFFANQLKSRAQYMDTTITWLNATYAAVDNQAVEVTVPSFYIHSSWYRNETFLLEKYFSGIKVTPVAGKVFCLQIKAATVFDAINLLALTSLLTHVTNEYGMYTWIDDSFALKYARILTNLEAVPYFVFYLYIKRTVRSAKQFDLLKPIFESYLKEQGFDAELSFYGTHQERIKFICEQLEKDISIVDIGCGELLYFKKMMKEGFSAKYHAIDEDDNVLALAEHIGRRYDGTQLRLYKAIDECNTTERVNVILTEVIEHNTPEQAKMLLQQALRYNFHQIIITTPNVSFNKFYAENLDSRHHDHHFEWNEQEFESFIAECTATHKDVSYTLHYLGDKLNNIQPTQAAVLTKIN
jgi:2-polyprenyl-3-methyl-5-hydroxy-6-metoxy-1,4-benzoquinol methylase